MIRTAGAIAAGLFLLAGAARGDDWPSWRGPAGNGLSAERSAPLEWDAVRNVKWKAPLPQPCNGSPVVSNGRVFVTCPEDLNGRRRSLYCFDRATGKTLWVRTVEYRKRTDEGSGRPKYRHETNYHSSSTPAADGKRVVVWHDSAGLFCYDFEGKELWSRDLGDFYHLWGHGGSPILHDGKVILNCSPGKEIFLTALDLATGRTLWKTEEPLELDSKRAAEGFGDKNPAGKWVGSWCTPMVIRAGGREQILCAQPTRLVAYDPKDGSILWWCRGLRGRGDLAYSSPTVADDVVVYIGGFSGPGFGVRLGGSGDVTETHRLWYKEENPQSIGSGVFLQGYVYMPFENRLECLDPKTGRSVWQDRGPGGGYWGSIVYAAGRCYVTAKNGTTAVFKPSPEGFTLLAANRLGEASNSTPAVSDGEIFLRTFQHLYCIGE